MLQVDVAGRLGRLAGYLRNNGRQQRRGAWWRRLSDVVEPRIRERARCEECFHHFALYVEELFHVLQVGAHHRGARLGGSLDRVNAQPAVRLRGLLACGRR